MSEVDDPTKLFRKSWSLYDAIAAENSMFHRELYTQVERILTKRHSNGPYSILDLGCGNARFLAPCLRAAPPSRYVGVDLSTVALAEAREYLAGLDGVTLVEGDMVEYVNTLEKRGERFDVIFTGYAMHHLSQVGKRDLIRCGSHRMPMSGEYLIIDVLREQDQSREDYIDRYLTMMREEWTGVPPEMIEEACAHVAAHDHPETFHYLAWQAEEAGWRTFEIIEHHGPHHLLRFSE